MSYDLSTKDPTKLVHKQTLKGAKKLTLRQTMMPQKSGSTQSYILADISGSMSGDRMAALKEALHKVWRPGVHGVAFESEIYDFTERDIDQLSARNSTNMLDALQAAWDDKADHIILLTDGMPDQSETEILQNVRAHSSTPIDTIGIGDGCNTRLLQEISEITSGRFNSINEPFLLSEVMTELLQIEASTSGSNTIQL